MGAFNKLMAYTFAILLSKPFPKWKAFELGLIDEKGKIIKKPTKPEEKKSLGVFENLIRKIKKLMIKVIPDNRFLTFMITAYLLKSEETECKYTDFKKQVSEILTEEEEEILKTTLAQCYRMNLE
jgi:hypothetical protein